MLTNNKIKFIKSLEHKKYRKQHACYVVEGEKMVLELLQSKYSLLELYITDAFMQKHPALIPTQPVPVKVDEKTLKKASHLQTATQALALVAIKDGEILLPKANELALALDHIQDPGNLGTIIRSALWFGIKTIYCSIDTVDVYNPKVVQATMGALFRVNVVYTDLDRLIEQAKKEHLPLIGTRLDGTNLYQEKLPNGGIILMGNESKGLSVNLSQHLDFSLLIPSFPAETRQMESLNVSVATALVLAEFRRQQI
ncbi:MAG: RNA methyltransferase [Bacteroidetes bacterium HGW-Bacteroidetes-4]|jgi:TrmH family RNA methyltransferase|nr:MAG: RNA methyltransferase [Bacteroidetes bacterium HGW-Bacteroidetes-4]